MKSSERRSASSDVLAVLELRDAAGKILVRPCIEVCFYSASPRSDCFQEFSAAVDSLFGDFVPALGWYRTNDMAVMKRVKGDPGKTLASTLSAASVDAGRMLGVELHAGSETTDYAVPSAFFLSEEFTSKKGPLISRHILRFCYPTDAKGLPESLLSAAQKCTGSFITLSGYAGWSQYWNVTDSSIERQIGTKAKGWLLRFPGLSYGDPVVWQDFVDSGLLSVGWLTWVSPTLTRKAKTVLAKQAVRKVASSKPGQGVVLFRAADAPLLGDVNRNDWPEGYARTGQVLAPLRIPDEMLEHLAIPGFDDDEIVRWYMRFFEDREVAA